jgi:hypothetical protein
MQEVSCMADAFINETAAPSVPVAVLEIRNNEARPFLSISF